MGEFIYSITTEYYAFLIQFVILDPVDPSPVDGWEHCPRRRRRRRRLLNCCPYHENQSYGIARIVFKSDRVKQIMNLEREKQSGRSTCYRYLPILMSVWPGWSSSFWQD